VALHPAARDLEDWSQDGCFVYRGARHSAANVVIVGLDEDSLNDLPKPLAFISPELAKVVTYLKDRGAAAIGIDVLIPESLDAFEGKLEGEELWTATAEAGNVIYPASRRSDGSPLGPLSTWGAPAGLGLVNMDEDHDHFLRRQRLADRIGAKRYDHFALALLNAAGQAHADEDHIVVAGRRVAVDGERRVRINFVGPTGTIPVIPFRTVLAAAGGGPDPVELRGAYVIIGATAFSMGDFHATPYSNGSWRAPWVAPPRLMSGPEVQANVVATLLDGAYITTPWWLSSLPQVTILGALLGAAFSRLSLARGAALAVTHHFGWKLVSLAAFTLGHYRVEIVAMLATGAVCYSAAFVFRWRWLRRIFGVVKGEVIARALEDDPGHLLRLGSRREVTVLFGDIRGFTAFSEAHAPEQVVALLNAYFAAVVPELEAQGATVDKYLGDGIMAFFNAPADQPDHALRAARAAVAIVRRVHERADVWRSLGFPGLQIGVGVHTGDAVVGTIGSPQRLDYTAIGDTVNTAARIEVQNKALGTEILLSAATYAALPEPERSTLGCSSDPEPAALKGKATPLALHRVRVGIGRDATLASTAGV
jgi:adenylate cyclase